VGAEPAKLVSVPASRQSAADRDRWAAAKLLTYFVPRTGRWLTPTGEAWQPALAVEAVLNTYEHTRDAAYLTVVERSFARYRGRRSHFFDDDGWYLNAWLRTYDATGGPEYLAEARSLFAAMAGGWDDTCNGGLWWNNDRTYKNAITNELFLLAAAGLHRRSLDPTYRGWAVRAWTWFDGSGLINDAGLVNDGLDPSCANNGQATWTYNQGVILSGLVELWRITGDQSCLTRAQRIADAVISHQPDGILREPGEPRLRNRDAYLFKGIFAQGLARLYDADRDARPAYGSFLAANADAAWELARDVKRGIGMSWRGPAGRVNAATHTSACLLLGNVALLWSREQQSPKQRSRGQQSREQQSADPGGEDAQPSKYLDHHGQADGLHRLPRGRPGEAGVAQPDQFGEEDPEHEAQEEPDNGHDEEPDNAQDSAGDDRQDGHTAASHPAPGHEVLEQRAQQR
jgi:predicted alpha-1,6-mannanase (GH76 family)